MRLQAALIQCNSCLPIANAAVVALAEFAEKLAFKLLCCSILTYVTVVSVWCTPRPESVTQHLWNSQKLPCESAIPFHSCLEQITRLTQLTISPNRLLSCQSLLKTPTLTHPSTHACMHMLASFACGSTFSRVQHLPELNICRPMNLTKSYLMSRVRIDFL